MDDGGINAENSWRFKEAGMTVGEYSSALLKDPGGKLPGSRFRGGSGQITVAVKKLRKSLNGR
jgi:hypothetical protein